MLLPLREITSMILLGNDLTKEIKASSRIKSHCFNITASNSFLVANCLPFAYTALVRTPHKFSIGLRSGLFADHSKTGIFLSSSHFCVCIYLWILAPSCINIQSGCIKGSKHSPNISVYFTESYVPFIMCKSKIVPFTNAPQIIREPPPN